MIGKSVPLYKTLLLFFRRLYVRTRNTNFCTLRAYLLMAFHDANLTEIYAQDMVHKFAWGLDSSIAENSLNEEQIREMQSYFEAMPPNHPAILDVAMIIAQPNSMHMLYRQALHILHQLVANEELPREDENLRYVTQLITLGIHARPLIENQIYRGTMAILGAHLVLILLLQYRSWTES